MPAEPTRISWTSPTGARLDFEGPADLARRVLRAIRPHMREPLALPPPSRSGVPALYREAGLWDWVMSLEFRRELVATILMLAILLAAPLAVFLL